MSDNLFDLGDIPGLDLGSPSTAKSKFSTLIYGRMKSGKTWLAASAAEIEAMSPILWIAAEDGTASFGDSHGDKIDVVRPRSAQQVFDLVYKLTEPVSDTDPTPKFPTKYKTVVVDTLGAYQESVKRDYKKKNTDMDFAGWAAVADFPTAIVQMLHDSPYNSIFLAHHEKVKDDTLGKVLIMPYFLGKKAIQDIPPIVDNIFYLAKVDTDEGPVRVLQTQGTERIDAGGRFESKLPAQIVDPTFAKIYEALTSD